MRGPRTELTVVLGICAEYSKGFVENKLRIGRPKLVQHMRGFVESKQVFIFVSLKISFYQSVKPLATVQYFEIEIPVKVRIEHKT